MATAPNTIRRFITLQAATGEIRTAEFDGTEHIVVPVVALVEGVIQAMNAPFPELVLADRFSVAPSGWNGRPVFLGHPLNALGGPVSGNSPDVLETSFGKIFGTHVSDKRLLMEAWLDPKKAKAVSEDAAALIERVLAKEMIEISTGAFIVMKDAIGTHKGKQYRGLWDIIIPDHLALLPEGTRGACSIEMGCGTPRAASAAHIYKVTASGLEEMPMADTPGKDGKKTVLTKIKALVAAVTGLQYTDTEADEAAELIGYETIKTTLAAAQAALTEATTLAAQMIADEGSQAADETAEETVETARLNSLLAYCSQVNSAMWSVQDLVLHCLYEKRSKDEVSSYEEHERAAKGARNSAKDKKTLQDVHDGAVKLGAACAPTAAESHDCGCGGARHAAAGSSTQGEEMATKAERITALIGNTHCPVKSAKALELVSDDELKALEEHCVKAAAAVTPPVVPPVTPPVETPRASAETPKPQTIAEFMATAPAEVRSMVERAQRQEIAAKTTLVGQLKAAQTVYTEAQLQAMDLEQLTSIGKLLDIRAAAATDFSGLGFQTPPPVEEPKTLTPPDGYRAALDKRQNGSAGKETVN